MASTVAPPDGQLDYGRGTVLTEKKVVTIPHPDTAGARPKAQPGSSDESSRGMNSTTTSKTSDEAARDATTSKPKTYAAVVGGSGKGANHLVNGHGDFNYPELPTHANLETRHRYGWRVGGVRFAPLRVPMFRRLQTAAVLFHTVSIVLFISIFWLTCANPLAWPILVPYLVHLSLSTGATDGRLRYRSEWMRSLPIWKLFVGYFPMTLHKTHDLDPKRKYILGYHPHGIISHGAWAAFATNALGFSGLFPGITNTLLTLDSNFRLPFNRDWILLMGLQSVSKESIWNLLTKGGPNNDGQGRAVTIVVGGARESLEAQPGTLRLILKKRKGFIKMALRTGADLVPVIGFGENNIYDQLTAKTHPLVHRIQMVLLKVFKFTLPALHGRGILNYDVGIMPYRRPVHIVVGKPIKVDRAYGPEPEQEDIDRLHALYVREIERMWDAYKDQFLPNVTMELI